MRSFVVPLAPERDGQQMLLEGHAATLWVLQHWLQAWPLAAGVRLCPERLE